MNGGELRLSRIEDWLDLCLLIGSQVQLIGQMLQAKRMAMPLSTSAGTLFTSAGTRLCLDNDIAAKSNRSGGDNC